MQESIIENFVHWLSQKVKSYKYSLCSTLFVGLLTYLFSFTNKLINLDDVAFFFFHGEVAADHGRWMLDVTNWIMPKYSMPWIYGVISLAVISIAICVIIKVYRIRNKYLQFLISGVIISFPSLVGMLSYMFLSYSYSLSFLLSVLSVYYYQGGGKKKVLLGGILLVISMGLYQAYLAVTVSFFLLLLFQDLLKNETSVKIILMRGLKMLAFILVSSVAYYLLTLLIFNAFGIHFNSYSSERVNNNWGLYPRVYWLIVNLISCLLHGTYGFVNTILSKAVHAFFILLIVVTILYQQIQFKRVGKFLLALCLLATLPFCINCIHLITPTGTHSLTLLSFIALYVLVVIMVQSPIYKRHLLYDAVLLAMALLIANNVLIANKAHIKQYLQYEEAHAYYTGVMMQVERTKGFDKNSKLALIGTAHNRAYDFSDFVPEDITGIEDGTILNIHSRKNFIKYYVGFDMPFTTEAENEAIRKTVVFKKMPEYPYYGSVRKIGNNIIVKLSE